MGREWSMATRVEITKKYARAYAKVSKKERGVLLEEVVAVTGWLCDNARRGLSAAAKPGPRPVKTGRKPRSRKYSYDARKVLQRVWAFSGGQRGSISRPRWKTSWTRSSATASLSAARAATRRRFVSSCWRLSPAMIGRYLAPARARDPLRGVTTMKPSPLLRCLITVGEAGDEVENTPGFFEGDTLAHCGPTMRGEFCRTMNLTCMHTGWTFTGSIRNTAHVDILAGLTLAAEQIPFEITGLDFDNGSESINHEVIDWAAGRMIFLHQVPAL